MTAALPPNLVVPCLYLSKTLLEAYLDSADVKEACAKQVLLTTQSFQIIEQRAFNAAGAAIESGLLPDSRRHK